jgi:hypothetical protein
LSSDLDAGLIPITVPELPRCRVTPSSPRPGETSPATSTAPAKPRQHHDHNELQQPARQDIKEAPARGLTSCVPGARQT